jgi:precorrin-6A/cobalt-precorrin-6A reductase
MNVMLMAGTKDASRVIKKLSTVRDVNILATTTTRYGAEIAMRAGADDVISKGLQEAEMIETMEKRNIQVLIDATHPFAVEATRNAIKAAKKTKTRYIRFERPDIYIPDNKLIYEVDSFDEAALKALKLTDGRILHSAGVSTLKYIVDKIDPLRIIARVLPSIRSIKECADLGLPSNNIIAIQGTFSSELNQALMQDYDISLLITKESGETGGTPSKIQAALELGLYVVLVRRPEVPELEDEEVFTDIDQLYQEFSGQSS